MPVRGGPGDKVLPSKEWIGCETEFGSVASGGPKPSEWSWADETEKELLRGERVPAGEAVRVPEAPAEAEEQSDRLVMEGERLGAAGRGRTPLRFDRPA